MTHPPAHRTHLALLVSVSAILGGCPDNPGAGCPQACELGFQCDIATRTCIAAPRARYERAPPGRAVRIAAQGDLRWTASLDPSDGGIVVTEIDAEGRQDARLLATPARSLDRRLAITASTQTILVAWLAASGEYELAWRHIDDDHSMWNFDTVVAPSDDGYTGTNDFDLATVGEQGVLLAFRDRNRSARLLVASAPSAEWLVELVDDGSTTDDGITCPDQLRRVQPAAGVGHDIDLAVRGSTILTAYYDADCGDLRLARRGDQRWAVTVVDTGDSEAVAAERGLTGRWPSIAFDPGGAPAVAYHDVSSARLMFAAERDERFEIEVVDAGFEIDAFSRERKNLVGAFASLALDSGGAAAIVYFDATSADLRFASRGAPSAEWSRSTLVADGAVGFSATQVHTDAGRTVVAERLTPAGTAFESELVLLETGQ